MMPPFPALAALCARKISGLYLGGGDLVSPLLSVCSSRAFRRGSVFCVMLVLLGVVLLWPLDMRRLSPSPMVLSADGQVLRAFLSPQQSWRLSTAPEDVDPLYLRMLTAWEDRRFYQHAGVDVLALGRAVHQSAQHGRIVSGASTLSMQVARLLNPTRTPRHMGTKLLQMRDAIRLEIALSKDEILRAYLTLAPFGGNIEGVRAGSLAWLGKAPRRLTAAEAALLVALPQQPERARPDRNPDAARAARDRVLARMAQLGILSPGQAQEATADPLPSRRHLLPFRAPHLAERLRIGAKPGPDGVIRSWIAADLQTAIETVAQQEIARLDPSATLAVMVVDNASRKVQAAIGSASYFDAPRQGAVDMTFAVRSPGSTLKPTIYAMAFDEGWLHPQTLIRDQATAFGDYAPQNFLQNHEGDVTACQALQLSLNMPAVAVLDRLSPVRFDALLRRAGVKPRLPAGGAPALPMALGGVGVTLHEMMGLYVALADGGLAAPLLWRQDDKPPTTPQRLFSPAAAWQVADCLLGAPPAPGMANAQDRANMAFKTGTSYGFRDAWAFGFDGKTTVGVWVGRADGSPSPGRIGRDTAVPILMQIFALLPPPHSTPAPYPPPEGVRRVASSFDLPPALRRLVTGTTRPTSLAFLNSQDEDSLRIVFPPDGATLDWNALNRSGLDMVIRGGTPPYSWMVNDTVLPSSNLMADGHQALWHPSGQGAVRLRVVDSTGQAIGAEFWMQ